MGDMAKVVARTTDRLLELTDPGASRRKIEEALWEMWEASYRDGYKDGQEDAECTEH